MHVDVAALLISNAVIRGEGEGGRERESEYKNNHENQRIKISTHEITTGTFPYCITYPFREGLVPVAVEFAQPIIFLRVCLLVLFVC